MTGTNTVNVEGGSDMDALVSEIVGTPGRFLVPDNLLAYQTMMASKKFFEMAKSTEPYTMSPLPNLSIDGFDLEQIWEQVQLQNVPMMSYLRKQVERVVEDGDVESDEDEAAALSGLSDEEELAGEGSGSEGFDLSGEEGLSEEEGEDGLGGSDEEADFAAQEEDDEEAAFGVEDDDEEEADDDEPAPSRKSKSTDFLRPETEVDDAFFSVREMERFADMAEEWDEKREEVLAKEAEREDEDEDQEGEMMEMRRRFDLGDGFLGYDPDELEDSEDDQDVDDIRYEDFFAPPKGHSSQPKPSSSTSSSSKKKDKRGIPYEDEEDDDYYKDNSDQQMRMDEDEDEAEADFDEDGFMDRDDDDMDGDMEEGDEEDGEGDGELADRVKNLFADEDDGEEGSNGEALSRFEKQQAQLSKAIESLEKEAVASKPWMLRGEIAAKDRPSNSLLEAGDLDVDIALKPAPVVTEETTKTLEDLIKRRIRDAAFDDVERKVLTVQGELASGFDPNRRFEIPDEKSSKSLSQIYEEDFVRKSDPSATKTEKDIELEKQHTEIDALFTRLCQSLDALSNWHFTPKPLKPSLEIMPAPSVPAIAMEEALPSSVAVSETTLLAPQEVFSTATSKGVGPTKGEGEQTATDKRRSRLKRKRAIKAEAQRREKRQKIKEKEMEALGIDSKESAKVAKRKAVRELMGTKGVTIIDGDGKMVGDKGKKGKGGKEKGGAKVIRKGDKVGGDDKGEQRAAMLKL
ncbi:U3 snoRNP protein [Quaeritorhiza haematococci]|nr:U3 snoRNP protein [Quaeritorhiza haematococci]